MFQKFFWISKEVSPCQTVMSDAGENPSQRDAPFVGDSCTCTYRRIGCDFHLRVNRGKQISKRLYLEKILNFCHLFPSCYAINRSRRQQCPEVAHLPVENYQWQDSAPTQSNLFQKFTFSLLQYKQQSDLTVSLHMVVNWICP